MKKFLFLFLIVSHQVMADCSQGSQKSRAMASEPLCPRTSSFLDSVRWPTFVCQPDSENEMIQVSFRWNPVKELISLRFTHDSEADPESEDGGFDPSLPSTPSSAGASWELMDMPTDQYTDQDGKDYFEINYDEPNERNCSYHLKFFKTIPGMLKKEIFLEMNCDGVQSSLTLSCRSR